jgi:hypothetical protein
MVVSEFLINGNIFKPGQKKKKKKKKKAVQGRQTVQMAKTAPKR